MAAKTSKTNEGEHGSSSRADGSSGVKRGKSAGSHPDKPALPGRNAAATATRHNSVQTSLPFIGKVGLPARDELAFLGGVGALAVIGVIEWPIAALLGAGHILAAKRRNQVVHAFGEALEKA